jgi:hypothetical protein
VILNLATPRDLLELELQRQSRELIDYLVESKENFEAFGRELMQRFEAFERRDTSQDDQPHMREGSTHPDQVLIERLYLDAKIYHSLLEAEFKTVEELRSSVEKLREQLSRQERD